MAYPSLERQDADKLVHNLRQILGRNLYQKHILDILVHARFPLVTVLLEPSRAALFRETVVLDVVALTSFRLRNQCFSCLLTGVVKVGSDL